MMAVNTTGMACWLLAITTAAALGSTTAANPHCLAQLDNLCSSQKGTPTCSNCLKSNSAALNAAGCRTIDEEKYCGESPKPKECWASLEKSCTAEQKEGEAKCDRCVEGVDHKEKLNCSHVEELKFCDKAPKPTPIDHSCELQLIAACAPTGGNKGTPTQCDACAKKNAAKLTSCTWREELDWCTMVPEPRPVADECEKELRRKCGADIKVDPKECESCVKEVREPTKPSSRHARSRRAPPQRPVGRRGRAWFDRFAQNRAAVCFECGAGTSRTQARTRPITGASPPTLLADRADGQLHPARGADLLWQPAPSPRPGARRLRGEACGAVRGGEESRQRAALRRLRQESCRCARAVELHVARGAQLVLERT
eukprot:SAG11_NODE_5261_length_1613_cov_1.234478_1_plen_369_part_10